MVGCLTNDMCDVLMYDDVYRQAGRGPHIMMGEQATPPTPRRVGPALKGPTV